MPYYPKVRLNLGQFVKAAFYHGKLLYTLVYLRRFFMEQVSQFRNGTPQFSDPPFPTLQNHTSPTCPPCFLLPLPTPGLDLRIGDTERCKLWVEIGTIY